MTTTIRRRLAVGLAASAILSVPLASTPITAPAPAYACEKATIGGKTKCIAPGQFCAKRYQKDYKKYGYSCSKKDRNGRYHLV